jgi:hypothetical protein
MNQNHLSCALRRALGLRHAQLADADLEREQALAGVSRNSCSRGHPARAPHLVHLENREA